MSNHWLKEYRDKLADVKRKNRKKALKRGERKSMVIRMVDPASVKKK